LSKFDISSAKTYHDIGFDHISNKTIKYGESPLSHDDIVIVEGTILPQIINLIEAPYISIFVDAHKEDRHKRFMQKYEMRDMSKKEIDRLWSEREKNEDASIISFIERADFVFNNRES